MFSYDDCMECIIFEIETLHEDPFKMLGKFTLRARQDVFFNKTMLTALNDYIDSHEINWDA